MSAYDQMSASELREKLKEQQELYDEVAEERQLILGQQNVHLSAKLVEKYKNELDEIKKGVETLEKLLREKE
ncbi:hypothetical protein IZU99_05240 [Oscillospiraceae bacterium CM]|nr:hypothetical protein IZU99_05240 [Oscillospiraceae bacterium CM]